MLWTPYMPQPQPIGESGSLPVSPRLLLDNSSFIPYYEQIVNQIRNLIKEQQLVEGQTFYSEGELAHLLGISKMPVRQAFQKLRSEGLLIVARGKKPLVGSGRLPWNFQQLRGFSEEMSRRGLTPSARLLSLELEVAAPEIARILRLEAGDRIYCIKRLRLVDGEPVAVVTSHLPASVFPDINKQDLENQSLYSVFESVYKRKLHWAEEVIGAATARPEEARLLQAPVESAVLLIRETTYDIQQVPIEYSVSILRGDRYTATVVSVRKK
jgi:GntR family transcriptional regulator